MDSNEVTIKDRLKKLINELTKFLPDPSKVSADLWKFAKAHDRRAYQLMRFSFTPASDYKTVHNAIKEFSKRLDPSLKDTILPLLYRTSIILYNRSHVPAILDYSRTNERGLSSIAHELLTDISSRVPEVLKTQVREICNKLQEDAPSAAKPNQHDAVNDLKACASFAKKFPNEIPQDRKFVQAMAGFAMFGTPPETAKYAISIIMSASNKREMLAKDLVQKCVKALQYGQAGFLARMAAISQLWLQAPDEVDGEADTIIDFAVKNILLKNRSPSPETPSPYEWSGHMDEECAAKIWAIRILVNRVRSHAASGTLSSVTDPVYSLLNNLVQNEGELSKADDTPKHFKPRLRLLAARSFLKLCQSKKHDALFTPKSFHRLAEVAQDNIYEVREPFLGRLKKYLAKNVLPARFYTIPFLLAYEPVVTLKRETLTWLRSRATALATYQAQQSSTDKQDDAKVAPKRNTILENTLSRLLSLLAHHPDYEDEAPELVDMSRYIVFYLSAVANDNNVSLIYHVAQRVKASKDVVGPDTPSEEGTDYTKRLHILSDLATYTIRAFLEAHNWNLQSLPGRISLSNSLFGEIKDHDASMSVVSKNFLPESVESGVDGIVRQSMKKGGPVAASNKKRKSEPDIDQGAKKVKTNKLPMRDRDNEKAKKTSKRRSRGWDDESDAENKISSVARKSGNKIDSSPVRKSARKNTSAAKAIYRERDDSEDDAEMEEANEAQSSRDGEDDAQSESDAAESEEGGNVRDEDDEDGNEDTEMNDVDDEGQGAMEEGAVEPASSPPVSTTRSRSSRQQASASRNVSDTPVKSSGRSPRSSRLNPPSSKPASKAKSSPAQASPTQARGKRGLNKVAPPATAPVAQGRLTRSRA